MRRDVLELAFETLFVLAVPPKYRARAVRAAMWLRFERRLERERLLEVLRKRVGQLELLAAQENTVSDDKSQSVPGAIFRPEKFWPEPEPEIYLTPLPISRPVPGPDDATGAAILRRADIPEIVEAVHERLFGEEPIRDEGRRR